MQNKALEKYVKSHKKVYMTEDVHALLMRVVGELQAKEGLKIKPNDALRQVLTQWLHEDKPVQLLPAAEVEDIDNAEPRLS
jgi:hypothetical protein